MRLLSSLLSRLRRQWDAQAIQAPAPSVRVLLTTKSGTSIHGLLIGKYRSHFQFADGAKVMHNGTTSWHSSKGLLEVPREQIDYYYVEDKDR